MKQTNKDIYKFNSYVYPDRWASFYRQIDEIIRLNPKSVLEVGVGAGVLRDFLRNNANISYRSVDAAENLRPDVVGSVAKLPFEDGSFDVVCAFEVLEHLPFEQFETALSELARVARRSVILSLPHFGPPVQFFIKIPFFAPLRLSFKIPFPRRHVFNGQHYWEIGKKGYSSRLIRKILKRRFIINKELIPFENQYHHFYTLVKRTGSMRDNKIQSDENR